MTTRTPRAARSARGTPLALPLLLALLAAPAARGQAIEAELAGSSLAAYPHFEFVRAFNADSAVEMAVDPFRFPSVVGVTADLYVVEARNVWALGTALVDAGDGAETVTFSGASVAENRFVVAAGGELDSDAATDLGVGYDAVVDLDRDGTLSDGDLLDSGGMGGIGVGNVAGLYVVKDLVEPGPLAVEVIDYAVDDVTAGFTLQRTWYPAAIDGMGKLPLVVVSHGNGHSYSWYDYLQEHLASHGYVVMSHQNNTGPGVFFASTTTLEHTDAILGQQATIGGGVLDGHLDEGRIVWIGHSRGGEGIAIAYDRILDGDWNPVSYDLGSLVLLSSIAPTDFEGPSQANPHDATYHLLYGAADGDVCGCPDNDVAQAFHLLERATADRSSTYVHGADHNDFNCCGFDDFDGPPGTAIGRTEAQRVAKAAYIALIEHRVGAGVAARDYLWRQAERFRAIGVAPTTTIVRELRDGAASGKLVIDDYQTGTTTDVSSSGGAVFFRLEEIEEGRLDDIDFSFSWTPSDPFNGMTRARTSDVERGAVLSAPEGTPLSYLVWEVPAGSRDWTGLGYLSFRAAQGTRHPLTTLELADLTWTVALRDGAGRFAAIDFAVYGGGIEEPYQRTGDGTGAGWQNEMETVRIRLEDFEADGSGVDLGDVRNVAFVFGGARGPVAGRVGLDDLEVVVE